MKKINKKYPETYDNFRNDYIKKYLSTQQIQKNDELTVIVRGHLLVELIVEVLLKNNFSNDKILTDKNFTFFMKIELLYSIGIISKNHFTILQKLGEIRNKFAHHVGINLRDILTLNEDFVKSVELVDDRMKKLHIDYKDEPKHLFGLGVYYILGFLAKGAFIKDFKK